MAGGVRSFDHRALQALCRERDLTTQAIAEALGVDWANVDEWLRGEHQPVPRYVAALAELLEVPASQLSAVPVDEATLRDLREWAGLTLRDAGEASGIPWQTYAAIERGTRRADEARTTRIAAALGLSVDRVRAALARTSGGSAATARGRTRRAPRRAV
jgi:transcriptional regulator with XRE-family HTH domain